MYIIAQIRAGMVPFKAVLGQSRGDTRSGIDIQVVIIMSVFVIRTRVSFGDHAVGFGSGSAVEVSIITLNHDIDIVYEITSFIDKAGTMTNTTLFSIQSIVLELSSSMSTIPPRIESGGIWLDQSL